MPLVSLIQPLTTFLEKFDFMLTWQHKQEGFIVCLETSQRTASKRSKASNLRPTLHPWNSTRLATPNAYQLIALCLCNKLTRYGSPLKKVAGLMGAGLLPPRAFFQVLPLISVWQSSCPVHARNWPFLWRNRDVNVQKTLHSPWNKWALNELTALKNSLISATRGRSPIAKKMYQSQKIWQSRDRTPNERPSIRTTRKAMFTLTLSS